MTRGSALGRAGESLILVVLMALAIGSLQMLAVTPEAQAHGRGCVQRDRVDVVKSNGPLGAFDNQTARVRMISYWNNCARHAHPLNLAVRLTDFSNADNLQHVRLNCIIRPDDYGKRQLNVSFTINRNRTIWNDKPFREPAWNYRTHPRAECTGKVVWDNFPDDKIKLKTLALR